MCTTKVLLGRGALWLSHNEDAKKLNVLYFPAELELLSYMLCKNKDKLKNSDLILQLIFGFQNSISLQYPVLAGSITLASMCFSMYCYLYNTQTHFCESSHSIKKNGKLDKFGLAGNDLRIQFSTLLPFPGYVYLFTK